MKDETYMQQSFDEQPEEPTLFSDVEATKKLDVVKMEYVGAESVEWKELFSGFDTLKAITFSSGIGFISNLLDMFKNGEIIFGCEAVMSYELQEIMAFQHNLIERIKNGSKTFNKMLERIDNGSLRMYVARKQLSHEKIYLLSSGDGKKRVIMGSANMSYNAFSGHQRENVCYVDGEAAYNWYLDVFNSLKESSTDEIDHRALVISDVNDNIEELPIAKTIRTNKAMVIEPVFDNTEEIQFTLNVRDLASDLKTKIPKLNKSNGKTTIIADDIIKIKRHVQEDNKRMHELRTEYPQLKVDAFQQTATLNGEKLDLEPSKEEISKDVALFIKYMDGYNRFHGDYEGMQCRYFEFANWFFCSPFMAVMRDTAAHFDQNKLPYPVFGLLYGKSKAGKTCFLETLLKMMIGQKPKISAQDFTRSSIEGLKRMVQGAPIIVDDIVNQRFNSHAIETIKTDEFGVAEHNCYYPAVVISANEDVKAVSPEVTRRTVICRAEAALTNTEVMQNTIVRTVQRDIGTAFYREYLRRMFEIMPRLIESMKSDETESAPDILNFSSKIIASIIKEHADVPDYIRNLTLDDYFSEKVTGKYVMKTIREAWKTSKKLFTVSKRNNELRFNAGETYEANYLIKELPETLEAHRMGGCVVMNLKEASEFFGIDFKKRLNIISPFR